MFSIVEKFSDEEAKILEPFVSNTDKPIFVLRNLPEVIKGALFSRYSRSNKSLRRLLLDEFMKDKETGFNEIVQFQGKKGVDLKQAIKKAQAFYDRVLDGYGDDSVGELGGAHIACEGISNYAAKVIEDSRIGGSPLEKSTRYVWFDEKKNGEFLFFKDPKLMSSEFKELYLETNNLLFNTYCKLIEPMTKFVEKHFPLNDFNFFDVNQKKEVSFSSLTDEKMIQSATIAHKAAVRAKACDILRYLLPTATLTNVGIFGNGRFFQNLLTKMYSHLLAEIQNLAKEMHDELNCVIPSFVRRSKVDELLISKQKDMERISSELLKSEKIEPIEPVSLIEYDKDAEETILSFLLYQFSRLPLKQLKNKLKNLNNEKKLEILKTALKDRRNRRDKLLRSFENIYYTFDALTDFGAYRDLQRHRMLTQERQQITTIHGYETPEEIIKAGFKNEFDSCMKKAEEAYMKIYKKYPKEAQYVVPFAYRIRWYIKMNLREAFHFIELRSSPQGHPSYRKIAHLMFKHIQNVHPIFAQFMEFVDLNEYNLGRISAELRKEEKREKLKPS